MFEVIGECNNTFVYDVSKDLYLTTSGQVKCPADSPKDYHDCYFESRKHAQEFLDKFRGASEVPDKFVYIAIVNGEVAILSMDEITIKKVEIPR